MKDDTSKAKAPRIARVLLAGSLMAASGGCVHLGAAAWDRDLMAKQAMELNTHPNITAAEEHIYFSKEGSSGGRTFDGGGCGCN
ncbi:MAG: DUF4266 domain-containing protein [Alphaproteobacteria bacterium]|nr:DUF4266 domain-containing protein [Alphaproteobacteria bacterium]